jgi:peptidoglycan/xylan/chitin deacetylase (PgdA/CDA1 family)
VYDAEFSWPGGAHIAVVFNISWEIWSQELATASNNQRAGESVPPDAKYGRWMMPVYEHAYAETAGMQRLLDVFERHDIKASCYTSGLALELYPELAKKLDVAGHEFLVQGWDHSFLWEQTVQEQAESIDKTIAAFQQLFGWQPIGYSASAGSITPETFDIVSARGFRYCCGFRNCDVPFIIKRPDAIDGRLVGMNSYELCDYNAYGHSDHSARTVLEQWRDEFDVLYDEGRRGSPQMLAYGTHPFLSHGHRTKPMEEAIEYVKSLPGVWITTRGEIAKWVLENYPDLELADFYPESAVAQDRWYGLSTGAGGDEARAEALRHRKA